MKKGIINLAKIKLFSKRLAQRRLNMFFRWRKIFLFLKEMEKSIVFLSLKENDDNNEKEEEEENKKKKKKKKMLKVKLKCECASAIAILVNSSRTDFE